MFKHTIMLYFSVSIMLSAQGKQVCVWSRGTAELQGGDTIKSHMVVLAKSIIVPLDSFKRCS